jgi:Stress responsive A/B Barrel Domain
MFHHVVLFTVKPERRDELDALLAELALLPERIPEIVRMDCGKNLREPSAGSYDAGLIVVLEDDLGFAAYRDHPAHVPVADILRDISLAIAVVDFTT